MSEPSGITKRAFRALKWNYIGTIGRIVATFASQIILARLLGPEPFGSFGYAFLTVSLITLVVDMGLQHALIQTHDLTDEMVAVSCGRLLLAGTLAAAAIFLGADFIAVHAFSNPDAATVIRAMAPSLIVTAGISAATAVLSRDIEFKVVQLSALGAYVLGYMIVGVVAAAFGLGVWSLVLAWYACQVVTLLIMIVYSPRAMRIGNPFRSLSITQFGNVIMLTNVINWAIDSTAHVIVGRSFGAGALGQFTVANNLVKTPSDHLIRNLQTVLLPLASRAQDNDAGLRRAYLTVISGTAAVVFPTFMFIGVMADATVALLLGAKWTAAAPLLLPLSLGAIAHSVEALCGPVLTGRGEPSVELRVKTLTLMIMVPVLLVSSQWSIVAVAWGLAFVFVIRWFWMNAALMKRIDLTYGAVGQALRGPVVLAAMAGGVGALVNVLHANYLPQAPALLQLMIGATIAGLVIIAALAIAPALVLGPQLLQLLDQLCAAHPKLLRVPGIPHLAASARRVAA